MFPTGPEQSHRTWWFADLTPAQGEDCEDLKMNYGQNSLSYKLHKNIWQATNTLGHGKMNCVQKTDANLVDGRMKGSSTDSPEKLDSSQVNPVRACEDAKAETPQEINERGLVQPSFGIVGTNHEPTGLSTQNSPLPKE